MQRTSLFGLLTAIVFTALAGCGDGGSTAPSADGVKYLAQNEPAGAKDVIAVRKDVKDGDEVVVVGRIGGSVNPWIEGMSAFHIVDRSLKPCNEREGDSCKTPWDYCCDPTEVLTKSQLLVQLVDENGQRVDTGAKELLNVKELDTIVVQGKAKRSDKGDVTVTARQIFVRK